MSRWFRWYEGTTEDGKFRVVARKSRVTVRDVIALWAFILEDAANLEHRGVCKRDEDFMASILDFEDGVVEEILSAMEDVGMISVGMGDITICNFSKRQFDSDLDTTATERQRRKRERDKKTSNEDVTRDSRTSDNREQITDTSSLRSDDADASDPRDDLWKNGVAILKSISGMTDGAARSMIGKWLKSAKDDCSLVLGKIRMAKADRIGEPVSWITAAIQGAQGPPKPRTVAEAAAKRLRELENGTGQTAGLLDESDGGANPPGPRFLEGIAFTRQ